MKYSFSALCLLTVVSLINTHSLLSPLYFSMAVSQAISPLLFYVYHSAGSSVTTFGRGQAAFKCMIRSSSSGSSSVLSQGLVGNTSVTAERISHRTKFVARGRKNYDTIRLRRNIDGKVAKARSRSANRTRVWI